MQTESMAVREQNWLYTIRQVAERGITTKQWCAEHGVAESTFYRWKQRLQNTLLAQTAVPPIQEPHRFAQLTLPQRLEPTTTPKVESTSLLLRSGHLTLELPAQTGEAELAKILRAVRDAW